MIENDNEDERVPMENDEEEQDERAMMENDEEEQDERDAMMVNEDEELDERQILGTLIMLSAYQQKAGIISCGLVSFDLYIRWSRLFLGWYFTFLHGKMPTGF